MSNPHYLLLAEASPRERNKGGVWRFVLQALNGGEHLEAADEEPAVSGVRLELLAVVRGLEAIGQPSRVTLVTRNAYISRTLRQHLDQWRDNDWKWERYDSLAPIKNADLWRRIDGALAYHEIDCRVWRFDQAETQIPPPASERRQRRARANPATPNAYGWLRGMAARLCNHSLRKLHRA